MQSELKIIATVVVPYSLIMPAIYLYFYWKSFDIQPFEFISVTDSISYAFKPFILILLNLVPLCLSIGINAKEARSRPANEKGFLPKGISLPVIVIFNAAIFLLAEIGGEIDYWFFGCGVAMVVMCSLIMSYEAGFKESIKSNATRVTLFLAISLSPCVTVFFAVLESKNVLSNCTASYILPSDIKGSKSQSQEKLIYLGKLSDNLIFFEKKSSRVSTYTLSDLNNLPRKK